MFSVIFQCPKADRFVYKCFYSLTAEQEIVLTTVVDGHNALISGQAGTGKSFLVKEIYKRLLRSGKKVVILCSSGIAGTVYQDLHTSIQTVHSFYGLRTAELPWNLVVNRALEDNLCRQRIKDAGMRHQCPADEYSK